MGKAAVRFDKSNQSPAGRLDYLQPAMDVIILVSMKLQQGVAEGGDRGDCVHNLMGQHSGQTNP